MRFLFLVLLLSSCSFRVDHATIYESDLPKIREAVTIEQVQKAVSYETMDLGEGMFFSALAGVGLGYYESRIFYGGNAFPNEKGTFWDWYRKSHSGDE